MNSIGAAEEKPDNTTDHWDIQCCSAVEFQKPSIISTGIGFLDHMIDQFYSHAQIGISIQVQQRNMTMDKEPPKLDTATHSMEYINRHAKCNQTELLATVGAAIGTEIRSLIVTKCSQYDTDQTSTFACPLDEALTTCIIERHYSTDDLLANKSDTLGCLPKYTLSPYGIYPIQTGRTHIGSLQTSAVEAFWSQLAISSGLIVQLTKVRGNNAHHIVESSFKAFARALRNFLDDIDTTDVPNETDNALLNMYGSSSNNCRASIELNRHALILRKTKETSIRTELYLDGGKNGTAIDTGIETLDEFLNDMASHANISLKVKCSGDLYIDEHHTAEDVAISIGQVLNDALGDKAGLNRMWSCTESTEHCSHKVHVIMDLSNRPCLTHNVSSVLEHVEMVGDLSCEMFEHVLESIVINARMTVHIVVEHTEESVTINDNNKEELVGNVFVAIARSLGQALKYCSMVDSRRAGTTASSKGTLSV